MQAASEYHQDSDFLRTAWPTRPYPVSTIRTPERILFSHGCGVGLGDQFLCLPLVRALRQRFPSAQITVLTNYPEFWEARVDDQVSVVSRADQDAFSLLELSRIGFDLVLAGYHPGCLSACAGLGTTVVFCAGRDLSSFRCFITENKRTFEVPLKSCKGSLIECARFLGLFADIGVIPSDPAQRTRLLYDLSDQPQLMVCGLPESQILIHPSSAKPHKEWPIQNWVDLAKRLLRLGAHVSVSSGRTSRDRQVAMSVQEGVPSVELLEQMPLEPFLQLLRRFHFVLSGDTFVTHAIAAEGGPISVAVYGPTDPLRFCPPQPHNFFLAPLAISTDQFASALCCLATMCGPGPLSQVEAALGTRFCRALAALRDRIGALGQSTGSAAGLRAEIERCLCRCRGLAGKQHRALLVGSDELLRRLVHVLRHEPTHVVAQHLGQSPAARCARVLAYRAMQET